MAPSWDLFIIIFFAAVVVFGIALGRERAIVGVIASYIALITANVWGNAIVTFMEGGPTNVIGVFTLNGNPNALIVKASIFGAVIALLIIKGDFLKKALTYHTGVFSIVAAGMYSFLNAGIITTALVSFLNDAQRIDLLSSSNLANLVIQYQTWWIVFPVILMIVFGYKQTE